MDHDTHLKNLINHHKSESNVKEGNESIYEDPDNLSPPTHIYTLVITRRTFVVIIA